MKIGIISRNRETYSTTRLIQSTLGLGHNCFVIDPFQCNLHIACDGYKIYYNGSSLDRLDVVIPRLSAATAAYGAELIEHFKWAGVASVNKADAILNARNKFRSLRILAQHDIPIPSTFTLGTVDYLDESLSHIRGSYPYIIKPFEGTHGKGMMLLDTPRSLSSAIEAMCDFYQDYLVQPFIEECAGEDIRALIVGNKYICAMKRKATGDEFRANIHRGADGSAIELNREKIDIAIRAAKALKLDVAGVDMLETNNGPVVIEVNPSPGLEGIEYATGKNLARTIIKFAAKLAANNKKNDARRSNQRNKSNAYRASQKNSRKERI